MLAAALEMFLISLGLAYYVATGGAGLRVLRQAPAAARTGRPRSRRAAAGEPARAGAVVPPEDGVVYFVVPCMNNEAVIGETVRSLLSDPRALVVVVDDGSADSTGEVAAAVDPGRVMVVRRELPEARLGTGPALNAGFACVLRDAGIRGIAASRITVGVLDAGGLLSAGALDAVLPLFADQRVGSVQLPVRIGNRGSLLTVLQDLELCGCWAVARLGRIGSGTVSLGGTGQFTRLAAILETGATPWRDQPTAGLDLTLALAVKGWRLTSTAGAWVSQPGASSLRALISQRACWYHGHLEAVRRLRELRSPRRLSRLARLKLTGFLLVPWALVLPWSVIFNFNLLIMLAWILGWVPSPGAGPAQKIVTVVIWYTLSCLPVYMAGFLYGRRERRAGLVRAFVTGHLLLLGTYLTYAACCRAVYQRITGAPGGKKAQRPAGWQRPDPALTRHALASARPASPGLTGSGLTGTDLVSSGLAGAGLAAGSGGVSRTVILVAGPRISGVGHAVGTAGADTTASLPVVPGLAGGRPAARPARRSARPASGRHRASRTGASGRHAARSPG